MYLPTAQVEKAVHQLQDSKAICQMESAACPRLSQRGCKVGRGGSRGEIDYTCYVHSEQRDSGCALKVFWVLTGEVFPRRCVQLRGVSLNCVNGNLNLEKC